MTQNNIVDTLEVFEWNGTDFIETENTYGPHIPQCFGDADGDGLLEMGARRFGESRVWEQTDSCGILNNLVFESPDSFSQFLISRFVRLDSSSNHEAIIARANVNEESQFALFEVNDNYVPHLIGVMPNETDGLNSYGPPTTAVGDVDDDGLIDILSVITMVTLYGVSGLGPKLFKYGAPDCRKMMRHHGCLSAILIATDKMSYLPVADRMQVRHPKANDF